MRGVLMLGVAGLAGSAAAQTCIRTVVLDSFGGGRSSIVGVSADGRVVAGSASVPSTRFHAFRWTLEGGMEDLGVVAGIQSYAVAISADGRVVVGSSTTDNTLSVSPMRWTRETGMVALTASRGRCTAVSADGAVVIGELTDPVSQMTIPFRWTQATGVVPLPLGPNFVRGSAIAISPDGGTILGRRLDSIDGERHFTWTEAGGVVDLPIVAGDWPEAYAMSADASTIVGAAMYLEWDLQHQAFAWTAAGGTDYLHDRIARTSIARTITPDAAFIAGESYLQWGVDHAFRWDKVRGFLDLGTLNGNYARSVAYGISADGSVVVGTGRNASNQDRGVIWTIVDLGTDFNRDGFVDFFDYDAFVACFEGGACPDGRDADHNGDGFVDFFDYDSFVAAFESGC